MELRCCRRDHKEKPECAPIYIPKRFALSVVFLKPHLTLILKRLRSRDSVFNFKASKQQKCIPFTRSTPACNVGEGERDVFCIFCIAFCIFFCIAFCISFLYCFFVLFSPCFLCIVFFCISFFGLFFCIVFFSLLSLYCFPQSRCVSSSMESRPSLTCPRSTRATRSGRKR